MLMLLFAQTVVLEKEPATYTPDWWFNKLEQHGLGGGVTVLILYFAWKYGGRIIEAFIAYMTANAESSTKNSESLKKLTEITSKQDSQMEKVVVTQDKTVTIAQAIVDMHSNGRTTTESRMARAMDLVDLAIDNLFPAEARKEAHGHVDALRSLASHR